MTSAWAAEIGLVLGQIKTDDKPTGRYTFTKSIELCYKVGF